MKLRRARAADAAAIHSLITRYAERGLLLARELSEIRAKIPDFLMVESGGEFAGCVSLELYGDDLAEIRSLAVVPEAHSKGLGKRLLYGAVAEAKRRGITQIFAVTEAPQFFVRHGFQACKQQIPREKIERDCRQCPKAARCELVAVVAEVIPARAALRILEPSSVPLPV